MDDPRPQDGALRQLENDPASRKRFLKMVGAGGAGALALLVAACGSDDSNGSNTGSNAGSSGSTSSGSTSTSGTDQFGKGDVGIAKYALTLEYLEADFYAKVANSGMLKGKLLETARKFGNEEQAHVDALIALIKKAGGKPATAPKTNFPLENEKSILKLAATVENLGARAYLGQAANIQDKEILAAALSIHSVEARHAAVLNLVTNAKPSPGPFASPASADEVLKAVKPFIVT